MPITINPIRKEKVKQDLMNGIDAKTAMFRAGHAPNTAHNATSKGVVKDCQSEILHELKAKDVTVDMVISRLNEDRELARANGDVSTMKSVDDSLARFLAMYTDKQQIDTHISQEDKDILARHRDRLGLS